MESTYRRNGSAESSTWKTEQDRFQGFTRAKLEDIEKKLDNVCGQVQTNKNEINNQRVKSAMVGGFAGFVGGILRGFMP